MKLSPELSVLGIVGALMTLMYWVSQRSGPGIPYYGGGDIAEQNAKQVRKRSAINTIGLALIIVGGALQIVAAWVAR